MSQIEKKAVSTVDTRDFFYPFAEKKLSGIRIHSRKDDGTPTVNTLAEVLGEDVIKVLSNHSIYIKKAVVPLYLRVCEHNSKQIQKTKEGAGSGRSTRSTKAGRGVSRLPRARVSGGKSVVSNIPQAVKGRLAQPLIKNATKLRMNRKQRQAARQSILYNLLRNGRLILIPETLAQAKTQELQQYLEGLAAPAGHRRVIVTRSQPGRKSTASHPSVLLDELHHSLHKIGLNANRNVILTANGLRDLLIRVFTIRKR